MVYFDERLVVFDLLAVGLEIGEGLAGYRGKWTQELRQRF